jgi:putative transposase
VILGHVIALDPTPEQESYFRRACGTARYAYNWGLAEWQRMYKAGEKPTMNKVKAAWNAYRAAELPWSYEVTKCASAQAIKDLGTAFANFFRDLKKPKKQRHFHYPVFKRKQLNESFALWNDQFEICGGGIRIPKLGVVKMREEVRFAGKINAASVSFCGGRWFVSVQVDVVDLPKPAPAGSKCGIDWGLERLASVSSENGAVIRRVENPRPRRRLAQQKRRMQRRIGKQKHRAKLLGVKSSNRQYRRQLRLSKLCAREANIRADATHKFTTSVAKQFETVVLEDLNVSGMAKNHSLAGSVLDANPYEIRRQLEYKTAMRGGRIVVADRFFPSSKMCSTPGCGWINESLTMKVRQWTCERCGVTHDRDDTAATNLERYEVDVGPAMGRINARGDGTSTGCGSGPASVVGEPRTEDVHICAH